MGTEWRAISMVLTVMMLLVIVAVVILFAVSFLNKTRAQQIETIKSWLLYAVIKAQKELGTNMGRVKLGLVYDEFVQRFPWIAKLLPFKLFSELVDDALDEMHKLMSKNENICNFILNKEEVFELVEPSIEDDKSKAKQ